MRTSTPTPPKGFTGSRNDLEAHGDADSHGFPFEGKMQTYKIPTVARGRFKGRNRGNATSYQA